LGLLLLGRPVEGVAYEVMLITSNQYYDPTNLGPVCYIKIPPRRQRRGGAALLVVATTCGVGASSCSNTNTRC